MSPFIRSPRPISREMSNRMHIDTICLAALMFLSILAGPAFAKDWLAKGDVRFIPGSASWAPKLANYEITGAVEDSKGVRAFVRVYMTDCLDGKGMLFVGDTSKPYWDGLYKTTFVESPEVLRQGAQLPDRIFDQMCLEVEQEIAARELSMTEQQRASRDRAINEALLLDAMRQRAAPSAPANPPAQTWSVCRPDPQNDENIICEQKPRPW
jgi:hypothetical protein